MFKAYPEYAEGGFPDRRTVFPGEKITFTIANALRHFEAAIFRVDGSAQAPGLLPALRVSDLTGNPLNRPCTPEGGCDWDPTCTFTVPNDWPSGWYRMAFPVLHSPSLRHIDFVVAERDPVSDVLFVFDTQTADAYNVYGGGSLYGVFDQTGRWFGDAPLSRVSIRRPVVRSHTYTRRATRIADPQPRPHEEEAFRCWLESRFRVAYVSNDSLERIGLTYLLRYPVVVVVGTQEYWSHPQVALLQSYVRGGGSLYLSAQEFAYGAIRLEHDGQSLVFFNDPADDPLFRSAPDQVATVRTMVARPEDFFGVSLQVGQGLGVSDKFGALTVTRAHHWVFSGLGFSNGDTIAGVRGLGVGAWVEASPDGTYRIVSSAIPPDQVDVLAVAPYPPLGADSREAGGSGYNHPSRSRVSEIPENTYAVLALVRQGRGTMFVGPGGWFNSPHPDNWDPRVPRLIEHVIRELGERSSS